MPLRYDSHQHHLRSSPDEFPNGTVLYFDPRLELSLEPAADRLRELGDEIRGADLVVLRGSSRDFNAAVCGDQKLKRFLKAVPTMTLAPPWDAERPEPILESVTWSRAFNGTPPDVDQLRRLELLTLLREGGAIFDHPGCHYELPSHLHASAFIRLADCLNDATDRIRLVDWILPTMREGCGIVTDTGSLLGLLSTVSLQATERFGWPPIPSVGLHQYPDRDHLTEVVRAFAVNKCTSLVFVMSVNSSGGLARLVTGMKAIDDLVIICQTGEAIESATVLSEYPVDRWEVDAGGGCNHCEESQLLVVDTRSYAVRTDLEFQPERLDLEGAEGMIGFWEAADVMDAVSLHVERQIPEGEGEQVRSTRHMAIYLDVKELLKHPWFRAFTIVELAKAGPTELIVIPRHAATDELAKIALDTFSNLDADSVIEFEGSSFTDEQAEVIRGIRNVLVLDDALITGSTLFRVQAALYEVEQKLDLEVRLSAFAVLSRPSDPDDVKAVRRRYGVRTERKDGSPIFRFNAAFTVVLPAEAECPFCREKSILEKRRARVSNPALAARIDHLANSEEGLHEPILTGETSGTGKTIGSFFGKLKPKTAFAAAASVAQVQKRSFTRNRPVDKMRVLDTTLVAEAFYDPALAAGVLRTFDQRDLRSPKLDQQFDRAVKNRGEVMPAGALTEIAWAAVARKLPPDGIRSVLGKRSDADPDGLMHELLSLD